MERRLAGAVLLWVALILTVAVPKLLQPALNAQPSAVPVPAPPAAGQCLDTHTTGTTVVPCTQPHSAEVTASWPIDDPRHVVSASPSNCQAIGFEYVGLTVVGTSMIWQPMLAQRTAVLDAPAEDRVGRRGWTACVIVSRFGDLAVGAVRGLTRTPGLRPAAFGWCESDSSGDPSAVQVSCGSPHRTEYLSETMGFASFVAAEPTLLAPWKAGCADLAVAVTGRSDPTFGGQLDVDLVATQRDPETGIDPPSTMVFGRCAVQTTGQQLLTGSVFGLGDAGLPFS